MKIGIFTFHRAINYGAVLQTYGLQEYLKSLGHEVFIIDYKPNYLLKTYNIFQWHKYSEMSMFLRLKMFLREFLVIFFRFTRKKRFQSFVKERLNLCDFDYEKSFDDFDAFIFGSDQIWNCQITQGFDGVFWGDFPATRNKKLISYAASAGSVDNIPADTYFEIEKCLAKFEAISVREKELLIFLSEKYGYTSSLVMDPVLLAGRCVFEEISENIKEEDYLLLFQLSNNNNVRDIAYEIARKQGLKVIEILSGQETLSIHKLQNISIEKFLGYFKKASYVVTSSFHGTALAILFHRNFNTISVDKNTDKRAFSLLKSLGIDYKFVSKNCQPNLAGIDYEKLQILYDNQREKSISFLRKSL